jgi:hypothetical protein
MRNHAPRSEKWIARELKSFKRADDVTQTLLCLVDIRPIPSLDEIGTWTPEQCMLSDDWARCCHFSASDNNNRVPARPEHLKPYESVKQRTPAEAAVAAIKAMSDDNGVHFQPDAAQVAHLEDAMATMQASGCHFTDAEIDLFSAGEQSEVETHFKQFVGFDEAHSVMNEIFDEAPTGLRIPHATNATSSTPPGENQ